MTEETTSYKRENLIVNLNRPIKEKYHLTNKILGQGTYGCVIKVVLKDNTKEQRACKIVPKTRIKDPQRFKTELDILKKLDHPGIVKLFEWFEDQKCFYLVMELLKGGELFDRVADEGNLDENLSREVFGSAVRAINYCHKCNIVHRDLKPENFMTIDKDSWDIKLIDFGLAKNFKQQTEVLTTRAGTPYYIAPEVLTGKYDSKCDIWSLGVMLYVFLCGYPPFYGESDKEILVKVKRGGYDFSGKEWENISDEAKDLIDKCLKIDPKVRIELSEILQHPWFSSTRNDSKTQGVNKFLTKYSKYSKFKKIVYEYLAMISNEAELKELKKNFNSMDLDGDGVLSKQELVQGLKNSGYKESEEEIELIFNAMDLDGSGSVEYTEFLAAMMDHKKYEHDDEKLFMAFKHLDFDSNGYIERNEIVRLLGHTNEAIADYILELVDTDGDGKISFQEFKHLMTDESFNK